jgi:hypothetical protein
VNHVAQRYTWSVTKYESVLAQALELSDEERELLVVQLWDYKPELDPFLNPEFIAELERRSLHAKEHPETLVPWEVAEKEIFGDFDEE